jgi:putative endonuclease
MSSCIYILQFKNNGRYYIGSTSDLNRRLAQHRSGHTHSTKFLGEFELVFKQQTSSLKIARYAEKRIKSWKRRDFIEKIIKDGKIDFLSSINMRV